MAGDAELGDAQRAGVEPSACPASDVEACVRGGGRRAVERRQRQEHADGEAEVGQQRQVRVVLEQVAGPSVDVEHAALRRQAQLPRNLLRRTDAGKGRGRVRAGGSKALCRKLRVNLSWSCSDE